MRRPAAVIVAAISAAAIGVAPRARAQCGGTGSHAGHSDHGDASGVEGHHEAGGAYRSPGLAAALSLTPLPVDFGNLYAENLGWGIAYTSLELGLLAPMIFIAADHGMGHSATSTAWSNSDRNWMIGLVSGYVLVKVASGLHAAHSAELFNREHRPRWSATIAPTGGGGAALATLRF